MRLVFYLLKLDFILKGNIPPMGTSLFINSDLHSQYSTCSVKYLECCTRGWILMIVSTSNKARSKWPLFNNLALQQSWKKWAEQGSPALTALLVPWVAHKRKKPIWEGSWAILKDFCRKMDAFIPKMVYLFKSLHLHSLFTRKEWPINQA